MSEARRRLLEDVPARERRLSVAGSSTALLEAGDGPPLVLVHGGIECGGVYWAPVIARLAEHHRVLVPDVPGLGESEPVARLDAAAFAGWLGELIRLTGAEDAVVVAHSLNGSLAARFAAAGGAPRGLVIYGAPGIGSYRMPLGLRAAAIRFGLRPTAANAERLERRAFHDLDRLDPGWLEAFGSYLRARAAIPHVGRAMRQLVAAGTERVPDGELRRIAAPTALVWGRHDRFVALRVAEGASARLGWPLHVVEDAGHVPHVEQPDPFVRALRAAATPRQGPAGAQPPRAGRGARPRRGRRAA